MARPYPVGIMPDHKRYINAYRLHLGASVLEWVLTGIFIFYPDVIRALDADHETNITWALIFSVVLMGSIITAPAAAMPTITETLEDLTSELYAKSIFFRIYLFGGQFITYFGIRKLCSIPIEGRQFAWEFIHSFPDADRWIMDHMNAVTITLATVGAAFLFQLLFYLIEFDYNLNAEHVHNLTNESMGAYYGGEKTDGLSRRQKTAFAHLDATGGITGNYIPSDVSKIPADSIRRLIDEERASEEKLMAQWKEVYND